MVRRPDVVIVNDPTKPPTQDNIKQVVEIKFPPDKMDERQELAYIRIAGDETKLVEMGPGTVTVINLSPTLPKYLLSNSARQRCLPVSCTCC